MAKKIFILKTSYGNQEVRAGSYEEAKANLEKGGKQVFGLAGSHTPTAESKTWGGAVEQGLFKDKPKPAPVAPQPKLVLQAQKPLKGNQTPQPAQQTQPSYTSLVDIYDTRPDLQKAFPQKGKGLDDWWNVHGVKEYAGTTLVQPGDPRISAPKTIEEQQGISRPTTPISYSQLTEKDGTIYKGDKPYGEGQTPEQAQAALATDLGIQPHEIDWSKIQKQEPEIKPIDDTEIEGAISPPDLPEPSKALDAYTTSLTAQVASDRKKVEDTYKTQIETAQRQIEASEKKIEELTAKEEDVITGDVQEVLKPFREKKEKAERERLKIEENYFNNQNSIKELEDLLNQAQSEIERAKGITGLAAIRQPRINKIKEDYAARVGIIQAVMAARNNQIAVGNNLIDRTITAITADKNDQINYYNTLLNFYATQKDAEGKKLFHLKADEKDFLNRQIGLIENDLANSQATVNYIKEMMLDPETANMVEQAGVKLNDSIETIQAKFANFSYAQEVRDQVSDMSDSGYQLMTTPQMIADKDPADLVRLTDTHGTERVYYIDEDELLSPNEAATLGVAYGTTRGQAAQMGITPARWKGTGGGATSPTKEFTRVKQIVAQHPNEWGHAADQIDQEFGAGTATRYDDYLKETYAGGGKAVGDVAQWEYKLGIRPGMTEEEKKEVLVKGKSDYDKLKEYYDKGFSRKEVEKAIKSNNDLTKLPDRYVVILDELYGEKKGWGSWFK